MGINPTKAADNMYCKCRKEAAKFNDKLNSREGAALLLGVSISSLSDYELGNTKVIPVDKVLLMADLYNAPELKAYYCKECCPLGCNHPAVALEDLDRVSVKALSLFRKLPGAKDILLDIAEDGVITEEEKPSLNQFMETIEEFETFIQQFKLLVEKNNWKE